MAHEHFTNEQHTEIRSVVRSEFNRMLVKGLIAIVGFIFVAGGAWVRIAFLQDRISVNEQHISTLIDSSNAKDVVLEGIRVQLTQIQSTLQEMRDDIKNSK